MSRLAVIRIRGKPVGMKNEALKTLSMLRLHRNHCCAIVNDSPSMRGMLERVKDYVTYGEIDDETFNEMLTKRGELFVMRAQDSKGIIKYPFFESGGKKYKPVFRLAPPKKGFERKGIKLPFKQGGALGNREGKINELLKRMI
ncbi:MAG: 50S ribosomal protein L30 [Nanoarchaeota archaeon]|nr:MAG: 50S ribosomal protein L30 [Nanoarchaeota archaeon]